MSPQVRHAYLLAALLCLFLALPAAAGDEKGQATGQPHATAPPAGWFRVLAGGEPVSVILIDKACQRLSLLRYDGTLQTVASYPCATGENQGPKSQAGDERTPEGIYFITKSYTDTKLTVFGRRAFHLDYPNFFDNQERRNGDGIYIHGTNRVLTANSTNGCIAMRNEDLDRLAAELRRQLTPVVIVEDQQRLAAGARLLAGLQAETVAAMILPDEMRDRPVEFLSLVCISDGRQTVAQGRYRLRKGPGAVQRGVVRGYLVDTSPPAATKTPRFVLGERQWLAEPLRLRPVVSRPKLPPAVAAALRLTPKKPEPEYPKDENEIRAFVERWRQAWQGKRIDDYIACYAPTFRQGKKDLAAWRRYKEGLNRRYRTISVTIGDIEIAWTKKGARVSFHQLYESDRYRADGRKILYLAYGADGWRITKEVWIDGKKKGHQKKP